MGEELVEPIEAVCELRHRSVDGTCEDVRLLDVRLEGRVLILDGQRSFGHDLHPSVGVEGSAR